MSPDPKHARLLVIKLGALGDFVQSLGPMAAIRRHHPRAHITLLTTSPYEELGRACGYFDDVWCDARPRLYNLCGLASLRKQLNDGAFSRVYDLQNNDRTSFYLHLLSPRPEWVGAARGASHRNKSPQRTSGRAFEGHVQTLSLAGISDIPPDDLSWMKTDITGFNLPARFVLLVPGASPRHPGKRWPAACYGLLARYLAQAGYAPAIIGSTAESGIAGEITATCPQAINLCGKTGIMDLPALARAATGAIGNDTGPLHLIAPTGCPSLDLFSDLSTPKRHAPVGACVLTLQRDDLSTLPVNAVIDAFENMIAGR